MHTSTGICSGAAGGALVETVAGVATRGVGAGPAGGDGGDCGMVVVFF